MRDHQVLYGIIRFCVGLSGSNKSAGCEQHGAGRSGAAGHCEDAVPQTEAADRIRTTRRHSPGPVTDLNRPGGPNLRSQTGLNVRGLSPNSVLRMSLLQLQNQPVV